MGYYDGRLQKGASLPDPQEHYSKCYDARAATGFTLPLPNGKSEDDVRLDYARVDTHYSTYYRILPAKYFCSGDHFPDNWLDTERKRKGQQRYSPTDTVGHYLGCTLDAALDESLFYGGGTLDYEASILLTIETYLENLLYLAHFRILSTILSRIGIEASNYEAMLLILDPETSNDITNRIGVWAREQGFDGIVYPSARFGQQQDLAAAKAAGKPIVPMINHICIQSRMDFTIVTMIENTIFRQELKERGIDLLKDWYPLYAELNVVLFSGRQLRGADRAIFWQTCPLQYADVVKSEDPRVSQEFMNQYIDSKGNPTILARERANRSSAAQRKKG